MPVAPPHPMPVAPPHPVPTPPSFHLQGIIRQDGTGFATFKISYTGLVCRPHKGEVLDCVVTSVNKVREGGAP